MRMQPLSIIQVVLAISVVARAIPLTQQPSVEARDASLPVGSAFENVSSLTDLGHLQRSDDELAARRFNWGGLLKTGEDIGENIVGDAEQGATGSSGGQPDCLPGVLAILNPACQTPESSNVPVQAVSPSFECTGSTINRSMAERRDRRHYS